VVIVVVVAVYFLFLKEPTPTGPTPEEIAAKKKAEEEREAAERKEAERLAAARREAERREAERREAERKAAEAKKASGEGKPKPAPKPAEASRPPIKDVDLDSLEPLDYAPGTSDNKKTEIDDLIQVVKEPYAGARGARARRKLVEIGYYAVPRIINILIKADYYSQDGVETAYALCRNLEDICEGLGYKVMTARDKKLDKPAWESEYYIKYNRQVAHSWYKLWKDQGGSRTSWEKYFKDLRSKEKGKEKDTKEKF